MPRDADGCWVLSDPAYIELLERVLEAALAGRSDNDVVRDERGYFFLGNVREAMRRHRNYRKGYLNVDEPG